MGRKNEITGRPAVLKELNISLLKDALAKCGQATRVELAAMTKISQPTVNLLIKELISDETVVRLGAAESTGGRRAEVYALNHRKSAVALLAVGDGFFETAVADMELKAEAHSKTERGRTDCLKQIERILRRMTELDRSIRAVSVGVPGAVSSGGEVFAVPSVPEWENFPLRVALEERLSLPVRVTNDINASAVGYCSLHKDIRNVVYLFTDRDGIGAGIMLNGELYPGVGSFAGELGYMRLDGYSVRSTSKDVPRRMGRQEVLSLTLKNAPKNGHSSSGFVLPKGGSMGVSVEELMNGKREEISLPSLLAQITVNLVCILNPEKVVLAGCADMERMIPDIMAECGKILPCRVMPQIETAEDERGYYFRGLGKLGYELLNRDIHIV